MRRRIRFPDFNKRILITVLALAAVIAASALVLNISSGSSAMMRVENDATTGYKNFDGGILQYTKERAVFYDKSWKQAWSDSYAMSAPTAVERGSYAALFETGGRNIRVYNKDGLLYNVQTSDIISRVSLAENGYIGVISGGDANVISVYSTSGNILFQRIEADSGVYPLSCDISSDGEIIAIGYIDTSGIKIKSKIGFFYVKSEKDNDYVDSMYAAVEKDNEIVFDMYFMSGNDLIAIGDRHITNISASGTEQGSSEVTNEIAGVGLCGSRLVIVYGEELPNMEGLPEGTVITVSSGGKVSEGCSVEAAPDYFAASDGGVVLGVGSDYYGVSRNGDLKWTYTSNGNTVGIYPTDNISRCIYAAKSWVAEVAMKDFDPTNFENGENTDANANSEGSTDDAESTNDTVNSENTQDTQENQNNSEQTEEVS